MGDFLWKPNVYIISISFHILLTITIQNFVNLWHTQQKIMSQIWLSIAEVWSAIMCYKLKMVGHLFKMVRRSPMASSYFLSWILSWNHGFIIKGCVVLCPASNILQWAKEHLVQLIFIHQKLWSEGILVANTIVGWLITNHRESWRSALYLDLILL